ncbi:MAG: FAD-dependent thymidylate synthase [Spirochaetaceae bacterium]|nr:FAD-dependent thymidylate synthase [Spirochaetaceae bacterium]
MITILEETTKNPITLMGARAGVCWGADTADNEKNYNRGLDCIKSGHGRVMEYVNVEMIIDGYSARVIREWYTHIGGAPTRLQASTRYINYKTFDIVVPPSVAKAGKEAEAAVSETIAKIKDTLKLLEEAGVPREDSAMLLPLGMTTKIVDKRNLRSLVDMSHQRMCTRAFWEYRKLFAELSKALADYSDEWKTLVDMLFMPKCELSGFCTEKKSCGRMPKKEE